MIQAVLFDLDGTLLDRDTSLKLFIQDQYDRYLDKLNHVPKTIFVDRFIELDNHGYVWKDKVYQALIHECEPVGLTWEGLLQDYLDHFPRFTVAFPNTEEVLKWLRNQNIKIGLITNGFTKFQQANLGSLHIEGYFDEILISEEEGVRKPDPEIFRRAFNRLKVHASNCIFVGDHPINDVKASMNAGAIGVWKRNDHGAIEVEPDRIIDDLVEIKSILENLKDEID
ncbi:HAD family hydrolase [Paenibacillus sp. GCM10027628]|uniref:HAD family hydrolase n=1 Tax=Paenibacillus sp. GCM10027628 TaxID=3273413 RepID=UPI003639957D